MSCNFLEFRIVRIVATLALMTAPLSGARAQMQLGVTVHNAQTVQAKTSAVGAGLSVRADVQWRWVEKTPGQLSLADYAKLSDLIDAAVAKGLKPIITLAYTPAFYDNGNLPTSAAALQAYAAYVRYVVHQFKGRVDQFEIWNEWNLNTGTQVLPRVWGTPEDYANLLMVASQTIKAEDPNAVVIGGVVGGTDRMWIARFIDAGGLDHLDAFSVHPYVYRHLHRPNPPALGVVASGRSTATGTLLERASSTPEAAMDWIDQLQSQITNRATGAALPIYISEIGWPTSSSQVGGPEGVEAAYLQRFLLLASTRPWIAGVWWYDLMDDGPVDSNDEDRFGVLRQDGQAKPAYPALLQVNAALQSASALKQSTGADGSIVVTGRHSGARQFAVIWLPTTDFAHTQASSGLDALLADGYRPDKVAASTGLSAAPVFLTK